ncbi:acetyltransferase [Deinococcus sp. NW-56]|uniref:acetyltransferase n=1 Tax=Deinococcus sp. NW-56 TaxID=2080419 RepID=UPI000CF441B9|nr:acetyltransferase [Deinococcus sp. NW-56]
MTELLIVGAGGFGREVLTYAQDMELKVSGFLDENAGALQNFGLPVGVIGTLSEHRFAEGERVIVAVGDPLVRRKLARQVVAQGGQLFTLIHPTAYVARNALVEAGCIICPFAMVGAHSHVGWNTAINTYASVGHDARIGAHTVFSPYSVVNGHVTLGEAVFLGTHASVTPGKTVGLNSKISAGSVVSRTVEVGSLVSGNPAKGRVMFATQLDE